MATAALLRDSGVNAIAGRMVIPESARMVDLGIDQDAEAGSTSATTFAIRIGAASTPIHMNGTPSARRLGGISAATLVVEEIAA